MQFRGCQRRGWRSGINACCSVKRRSAQLVAVALLALPTIFARLNHSAGLNPRVKPDFLFSVRLA